jgi:hypothetical protein
MGRDLVPDPDRRQVDGALVDQFPLVAAVDGVALLVPSGVEGGRPPASAAAVATIGFLVFLDWG